MNYLSKSDFKIAQTCPTMLFYKKQRYPSDSAEDDYLAMLADGGYMVEKIAKLLYRRLRPTVPRSSKPRSSATANWQGWTSSTSAATNSVS
jgi:hypothetical protein